MIIRQQNGPLVVIRQTDHAYLSGFFARELGNEAFQRPGPFDSFCLAAAEHDNGWQEWEMLPGVDPKTFVPQTFMTVPTEEHIALYQRGIERTVKADLYAGLLVAGHWCGTDAAERGSRARLMAEIGWEVAQNCEFGGRKS